MDANDKYFIKVVITDEYMDDYIAELEYEKLLLTYFVGKAAAEFLCDDAFFPSPGMQLIWAEWASRHHGLSAFALRG